MSSNADPTAALSDLEGVFALSKVLDITSPLMLMPVLLNVLIQKAKIIAVIPKEDQKAILCLVFSGFCLNLMSKF
jgi:hypothetical protein